MSDTTDRSGDAPPHAQAGPAAAPPDADAAAPPGSADGAPPVMQGRLHPSVIALWTLQAFAPLAALWIASSAERMVALAAIAITLLSSWVRWTRYRWRIEADQLLIEQGLLQRTRRVIPIERIQAVQTLRKIRHRAFGVVGLRIETVGGNQTEGQLDALTPDVAAQVQRRLLRPTAAAPHAEAEPAGAVLARCPPRMLLVAGLTGGRVGAAAAALAFGQQFVGERFTDALVSAPARFGFTIIAVVVALAIVAAFVLSVAATAVTYWNFTVARHGDLIRLQRGLLTERRDTVPLARVQSLTLEENVIRRALGLATVKMVVAGRAGEDESLSSTLIPIAPRAEAMALIGAVLDLLGIEEVTLRPMPRAALARRLIRAGFFSAAITAAALVAFAWPVGLLGLTSLALTVPAALGGYRALGWHRDDQLVVGRAGWLLRRTSITPVDAPQSLRVSSSPFQRRRGLATLRLEIARTRGATDPRLIDLDHADATRLQHDLVDDLNARLQITPGEA
ncbi:MAG TPA: PH domain-containing protein [Euzebyales bacterium]|nr:PH domain-containing protein [Euzebyales bacterium]